MAFSESKKILRVRNAHKSFGITKALDNVDFTLHKGEVMGLAGHNGAGKSVLTKIIGGIYKPDKGEIYYGNQKVRLNNINDAQRWGIFIVPQELNLSRRLSVAENIFLGRKEFSHKPLGIVNKKYINSESKRLLKHYFDLDVDPETVAGDLDTVTQRIIQVVRCLREGAKVIAFDETTAGLTLRERDILFKHIKTLAEKGLGIIFISHMISEMLDLCDTVTALRNGKIVGVNSIEKLTENKLVELIVGQQQEKVDYNKSIPLNEIMFSVKNASAKNGNLKNINFDVRKGEILGVYGLRNQGQALLMDIIYGAYREAFAEISVDGQLVALDSPTDSVKSGVSFLPERGFRTIFRNKTIIENTIVQTSYFKDKGSFINRPEEINYAQTQAEKYKVCGYSCLSNNLTSLSGGNIQKILLARTMAMAPKVLLLIEPTQGIDIGAREEIKRLIFQVAEEGRSVILVTSELDDILEICNRTIIIREGMLRATVDCNEKNKSEIVRLSAG